MGNKSNNQGLGVAKLALFSIGLTLASGVFSLSGDFAAGGHIHWQFCWDG